MWNTNYSTIIIPDDKEFLSEYFDFESPNLFPFGMMNSVKQRLLDWIAKRRTHRIPSLQDLQAQTKHLIEEDVPLTWFVGFNPRSEIIEPNANVVFLDDPSEEKVKSWIEEQQANGVELTSSEIKKKWNEMRQRMDSNAPLVSQHSLKKLLKTIKQPTSTKIGRDRAKLTQEEEKELIKWFREAITHSTITIDDLRDKAVEIANRTRKNCTEVTQSWFNTFCNRYPEIDKYHMSIDFETAAIESPPPDLEDSNQTSPPKDPIKIKQEHNTNDEIYELLYDHVNSLQAKGTAVTRSDFMNKINELLQTLKFKQIKAKTVLKNFHTKYPEVTFQKDPRIGKSKSLTEEEEGKLMNWLKQEKNLTWSKLKAEGDRILQKRKPLASGVTTSWWVAFFKRNSDMKDKLGIRITRQKQIEEIEKKTQKSLFLSDDSQNVKEEMSPDHQNKTEHDTIQNPVVLIQSEDDDFEEN